MKNGHCSFHSIFFVDDDEDDHYIFEGAIKKVLPDASVTLLYNVMDLLALITSGNIPDILFVDLAMPGKDGFDCIREIRKLRHLAGLPIVVYSSLLQRDHIDTAYAYGANLCYTKPSGFIHLVNGLQLLFKMNWHDPFTITSDHYVNKKFYTYDPTI